jgi:F-type H+-transporting ATPase subunit delta
MDASSRAAMAEVRERLDELTQPASGLLQKTKERLTGAPPRVLSAAEQLSLSDELFAVARLLDGNLSLRRALSNASARPEDRAGLARQLFGSKISQTAVDLVEAIARQRWSRPLDLVEATETLAIEAALDAAVANGDLESVEDELFRFGRIVTGDDDLSRVLTDRAAPPAGKAALLERLLSGRVSPTTGLLLRNVLTSAHVTNAETTIERLSEAASARRGRSVAHVTTAVPLTDTQEQRLTEVLGRLYGRTIGLQVTVVPDVLGGLIIRVGDEVIDGSIAHRLEAAGRRFDG